MLNSKPKCALLTREVPAILEDDQTSSSSEEEDEEEGEEEEPEEREDQTQQGEDTPLDKKVTKALFAIQLLSSRGRHSELWDDFFFFFGQDVCSSWHNLLFDLGMGICLDISIKPYLTPRCDALLLVAFHISFKTQRLWFESEK